MRVEIKQEDFDKIVAYAKKNLPDEACGLLAGRDVPGVQGEVTRVIEKVFFLTNIDHSNEHFSMDPREQLQAVKEMRALGLQPLGNWHSHPETPSRPSQEDIRLSYDSRATYMILSLQEPDAPVLGAFHVENAVVRKEELVVV